jgi:hypothetical protein
VTVPAASPADAPRDEVGTTSVAKDPSDPAHDAALVPVDVDGVTAVALGTVVWLLLLVACLVLREQLAESGRSWWTGVCLAGTLLGVLGLWFVRRRRGRIDARRAADPIS